MSNRMEFENIYDEFRTLELNKEYYGAKAEAARKKLLWMDIILALAASSSAVASFKFWTTELFGTQIGPYLLGFGALVAIVLGIVRPYLKLEDEHARLASMLGSYSAISHVMKDVVVDVRTKKDVSDVSMAVYNSLRQVRGSLASKEDPVEDRKLIEKIQKNIIRRYPTTFFYYPKGDTSE
ncbi:hypothetical protein ACEV85_22845 [Vibrio parahaemolyticus]|uniref:hypothetical protein n=1 Tax=Vibrio TaxID=662 RepID=UPI001124A989|nr:MULTISPECIES: hypothetical protein [Vibrio]EGQ8277510.1 hypothetical protein [Vibrio parahaemolyticus]EGR2226553.1 hypothetical protein [Vibrio parahaemolyticus]EGR2993574.1 hypothetical protein [Vibrio parahaemolyticus]EGR3242771.1 hypothetical protein [Vibrio parahaemolyticus]EJB8506713.1 hypothetical protein [Vibrio parahaemolyticus]